MAESGKDLPGDVTSGYAAEPSEWRIFHGDGECRATKLPDAPPWRSFARPDAAAADADAPHRYHMDDVAIDTVNAALHLRRPLLVTGRPGVGKSSLAGAIANELGLGPVLRWPVNSRSTLQDALYRYDAIGRLQDSNLSRDAGVPRSDVGTFVRLGPLGSALAAAERPRVLLVDELDKGDVDLPNDLLNVFEEGWFEIPELSRLAKDDEPINVLTADVGGRVPVLRGIVRCVHFPVVVITSNGERDFPPAFRRRCLPLHLEDPGAQRLRDIVASHLGEEALADAESLLGEFLSHREEGELATDQFLNAVFLRGGGARLAPDGLLKTILHHLNAGG